jgi:diguanylate cyclase
MLILVVILGTIIFVGGVTIVKLVDRLRTFERQAVTDPLTGAFNRRHLERCLGVAIERRIRFGEPACLVLFDVDRFKDINDKLGHCAGDAVLKALVVLIGRRARKLDVLCRLGGEEFALLLSGTTAAPALVIAEQIRALVARSRLIDGHAISISVGVGELREGQSPSEWIDDTDRALYHAKGCGRNRVAWNTRAGAALSTCIDDARAV